MLKVVDLDFDYQDTPLLQKVNLHLLAGGLLHLRGGNGLGKTTLLKLLAGIYQPSVGQIHWDGLAIEQNLTQYQQQLCFVGHKSGVNPYLTIQENCLYDLHYQGQDLKQLAAVFKLDNHLDMLCGLLSAGQRRQVGLLRLWMTDAKLWLLDEPMVALDDFSLNVLMTQIEQHRKKGGGVILTSHQKIPLNSVDYQEYLL